MIPFPWFVFDVESVGLFGDPFAVGWCRIDEDGTISREWWTGVPIKSVSGKMESFVWCGENIPAEVLIGTVENVLDVCSHFDRALREAINDGCSILCDCPFPVESNFLLQVQKLYPVYFKSPYPLYDIASVIASLGKDPLGEYPRRPEEIKHHPMWDAIQSGRTLFEFIKGSGI